MSEKCFKCKEIKPREQIKKSGKAKNGYTWHLCIDCSNAYAREVQAKLTASSWKGGKLCPRCESDAIIHLHGDERTTICLDCWFRFKISATREAREGLPALLPA